MPRPSVIERARMLLSQAPAAVSGQGGHTATFSVCCALIKGFCLTVDEARPLLAEWNLRCSPPWSDKELDYKLNSADRSADMKPRGYLLDGNEGNDHLTAPAGSRPAAKPAQTFTPTPKAEFDPTKLETFAGEWASRVDLVWLANRSTMDPSLVDSHRFLRALYGEKERVLVFTNDMSQGEALWPVDKLPTTGKNGVWFMCQPTDGVYHPNPRVKANEDGTMKMSRRSEESVTAWRYRVIESDDAPIRLWLGALAQLPLQIAALYTSGGRSVHALVRTGKGVVTKADWDEEKHAMKGGLITLGADEQCMSAVRLTRLPGAMREGKYVKGKDAAGKDVKQYVKFATPQPQKLLYLNPEAPLRPLVEMLPKRDVEADWLRLASAGISESDETGGAWLKRGLGYYAKVSPRLRAALAALQEGEPV